MGTGRMRFRETLRTLLEDEARATAIIDRALSAAGRDHLPEDPGELAEFVKWYVVDPLAEEIGASLARSIVSDLESDRAVRPRVALLCAHEPMREELRRVLADELIVEYAAGAACEAVVIVVRDIVDVARLEGLVRTAPRALVAWTHAHERSVTNALRPMRDAVMLPGNAPAQAVLATLRPLVHR